MKNDFLQKIHVFLKKSPSARLVHDNRDRIMQVSLVIATTLTAGRIIKNLVLLIKQVGLLLPPIVFLGGLILIKIILLLVSIAYFTIAERKVMAAIQRRRGPNIVGFWGLLQPLADGLKLFIKEMLIPTKANPLIFVLAPTMILTLSLVGWSVIPFGTAQDSIGLILNSPGIQNGITLEFSHFPFYISNIQYGLLFLLAISSLNVYGIIIAG